MTTSLRTALEHVIGSEGLLAIRFGSGEVRLRAVDGPAVRVRDRHDHDIADMFEIELGDGSLSLRVDHGRGWFSGRRHTPDLEVEVPQRAAVVIESASGDIAAEGLSGDQRYRTASGDVALRACAGRLAVDAVSGDVDIVAAAEIDLSARTVSGDLQVRAASLPSLRASTTSGDLKVAGRFSGEGPFSIETVSGDALLAPVGDVRIEMTTITGDLRSELGGRPEGGRGRRSLVLGSGGPLLTVRSLSGDLRIVRSVVMERPDAPGPSDTPGPASPSAASADASAPAERPAASAGASEPGPVEPPAASADAPGPAESEGASGGPGPAAEPPAAEPSAFEPAGPATPPRAVVPDPAPTERAATVRATFDPVPGADATGTPPASVRVVPEMPADGAPGASSDDPRLDILRSLERGEISVAEAGARLEALESLPAAHGEAVSDA